jgi:hypothetical protein
MNWMRAGSAAIVIVVVFGGLALTSESAGVLVFGAALLVAVLVREWYESRREP